MPRIVIAGNPNAGKSSIFNHLTGTIQQVSNYPGVTVECKEGVARLGEQEFTVIDLPGTYSLTAYSQEEIVARDVITDGRPDVVVDVLDATNLERNLYLAVQLMEMDTPLVLALNMMDAAAERGLDIDTDKLSNLLGVPVVQTVGSTGHGLEGLLDACADLDAHPQPPTSPRLTYGPHVDSALDELAQVIAADAALASKYGPRWLAIKLMEGDEQVRKRIGVLCTPAHKAAIEGATQRAIHGVERHFDDDAATIIAERRYGIAAGAVKTCVSLTGRARQDMTDQIDTIVCDRVLGPMILVGVVAALFTFVFKLADEWAWIPFPRRWVSPIGLFEWFFDGCSQAISGLRDGAPLLHSLLNDALIGGVGGVMNFVPLIFFMFLFIAVLEDSGYVARVAFLLDRVLRTFGLQGKSILALIVAGGLGAGGCAVPGVMATRTLREDKDRLVTMLVTPFMNCGAKMPVYAMLIAAFFSASRTSMMLLLWSISWLVALCAAWVLRKFVIQGEQTPFVMELPPYHMPTARSILLHTSQRTWLYIKKAGTIILAINILLWALMYFPRLPPEHANALALKGLSESEVAAEALTYSAAGRMGKALEPLSRFAGFDWRTSIALIGGFAAKEVVIGTLGTVYSMGQVDPHGSDSLARRLAQDPDWNPLKAFALMVFVMTYAPCLVTVAVIRRESGSWKWALFSTAYSTLLAFALATLIYQVGMLLAIGT